MFGIDDAVLGVMGGALLGGVGSVVNNERNLNFQREALEYNKWAQENTWAREDNAIRRRVNDLTAAGLSPVLAAGSAAQAGSPMKIDPMNSEDATGLIGASGGALKAAQTQQSVMAAKAAQSTIELNEANIKKADADAAKSSAQAAAVTKEWGLAPKADMVLHPKYNDQWGKRVKEIMDFLINASKGKKPPTKSEEEKLRSGSPVFSPKSALVPGNFGGLLE